MLLRLFPPRLDREYRGYRAALWIFGFLIIGRAMQSVMIIANGYTTVRDADGIPLDAYPPDAVRTILGVFAIASMWRLLVCLLGLLVLIRYRSAVPLMYLLFLLSFLGAYILAQFVPLIRVGSPPAGPVTSIQTALTMIGLILSIAPRRPAPVGD